MPAAISPDGRQTLAEARVAFEPLEVRDILERKQQPVLAAGRVKNGGGKTQLNLPFVAV
jgi:hypothetical protein